MRFTKFLTTATLALLPLTASAASLIIPASGTGPGANGSHWQTEVTLHNVGSKAIDASLIFHDGNGASGPAAVSIGARATTSIGDVVRNRFGRDSATGAIEVVVADADANKLAVTSRTSNVSSSGELGQDIPAVKTTDAAAAGDLAVISAPSSVSAFRFNFGLYAVSDAAIHWELVRADGTIAATKDVTYTGGTQAQYNGGVSTLLGAEARDNDSIHATVTSGSAILYGSSINNASGDPTFVPAIRTREDSRVNFVGVDLDENGTIDIADANHDGVLDAPIELFTSGFPNYFRVIVNGDNGATATLVLVDAPRDALLIDTNTVAWAAGGNQKGQSGTLKVRATIGTDTTVVTIPVVFR